MRKKKLILLIFCFWLIGCSTYKITVDDFLEKATFNGYIIKNSKAGYEAYDSIKSVHYAINRENAYNVQFLELNSEDYAKRLFKTNVDEVKKDISGDDYQKSKSSISYDLYHAETKLMYKLVIRINNNLIYIDAPIMYINEIEEFLDDLHLEY